jgi:hypothetical protein
MISSRAGPTIRSSFSSIGRNATATSGSAKLNASTAIKSFVGRGLGFSPRSTVLTRANVSASRANQPAVSELGACGINPVTGIRPCVGRIP